VSASQQEGKPGAFRLKIASSRLWKDMITAISTLIDEACFETIPEGIKLRAMDPSHVAMVDFEWPKTVFDEYTCTQRGRLCINVSEMLKVMKRVESDESVELSLDERTARLNVQLRGRYIRTFSMPTLETTGEEVPTPKITFNAKARVTTGSLRNAMDDVSTVSDHVSLQMSPEQFVMKSVGDMGSVNVEMPKGSESLIGLDVKEEAKATYSLTYLSEIVKAASNTSDVVTIEFSTDMPVKLSFELPQGGKLEYFVAPRIETE
jgi:proliferating cell nuclear antigen